MFARKRQGFTLLEIMIVVGILVLLAGLVVPNLIGTSDKAKVKLATAAVAPNGTLANALKQYQLDMGAYPKTEYGLKALMEKPADLDEKAAARWGPKPYLDPNTKVEDPWGNPYQYVCPGEHNTDSFDLSSSGPDGQPGNEDDIGNWTTDAQKNK